MATIVIFNQSNFNTTRKSFKTPAQADNYFATRLAKVTTICEPTAKAFEYVNEWGNTMHVQKMY